MDLQIKRKGEVPPNRRTKDKDKACWPKITCQISKQRTKPQIRRRTQESGVSSIRAPLTTQVGQVKQSLVAKMRASESNTSSDSESKPKKGNDKWKNIIDVDPNTTVATTKIQKEELEDPNEEEHLFHS